MSQRELAPLANTINDACRRLGVSRSTIYELIKRGDIRQIKVGSRTLIPERELVRFIEQRFELDHGRECPD